MEEIHGSERTTTRRKPLADIANTPSLFAASLQKPKPSVRKRPRPSAGGPENHGDEATPATIPKAKEISDNFDSVVCTRQSKAGRKYMGKTVAAAITSSCPPIGRTRNIEGQLNMEDDEVDLLKKLSVPFQKVKKNRRRTMPSNHPELPPDFVEKQRAYFAEIDAFELPEEFASESDIESEGSTAT